MPGSSFGNALRLTTFGESHGPAMGAVIDGMPAGLAVDVGRLAAELERRRPGRLDGCTSRDEADSAEILSGVFEGRTLGTPIAVIVRNRDQRPADYDSMIHQFRPGHADETTLLKHGFRDHRGGGRASGRETVARVIGGYFAGLLLPGVEVVAQIDVLGPFRSSREGELGIYGLRGCDSLKVAAYLQTLKDSSDSIGAELSCRIQNPPAGLGEPVFDKLKSDLGRALLSIGAITAYGYGLGAGFASASGKDVTADRCNFGGIEGGISNAQTIDLQCTVRAPSTVGDKAKQGRHDPCIAPRVIPVIEAMVKLVLADHLLRQRALASFQGAP
jgi:chorismate synthase